MVTDRVSSCPPDPGGPLESTPWSGGIQSARSSRGNLEGPFPRLCMRLEVLASGRGRLLGATIVGASAGELILPLVMAMKHGLTVPKIAGTIFPYPTLMEGVKRAADAYQRTRLDSIGGRMLKRVVRWLM